MQYTLISRSDSGLSYRKHTVIGPVPGDLPGGSGTRFSRETGLTGECNGILLNWKPVTVSRAVRETGSTST